MAILSIYLIERKDHPEHHDDSTVLYISAVVIAETSEEARAMHPNGDEYAEADGSFDSNRNWPANISDVEAHYLGIADNDSEACVILASTSTP